MTNKSSQYVYVGFTNGLAKFVHEDNIEAAKEFNNTFVNDTENKNRWQHFVTIPHILLSGEATWSLRVKQFFENESGFPWLTMLTDENATYVNQTGHKVKTIAALGYDELLGELATYQYMMDNNLSTIVSYAPSEEFGYNSVKPDIWVRVDVAKRNGLLPASPYGMEYLLDI